MVRRVLVIVWFVCCVALGGACAPNPPNDLPDGWSPPDSGLPQMDAAVEHVDEPKPCTPMARPAYVPQGFVPWDGFPCSGIYVPPDASQLPPTFAWEDCGPDAVPQITGCKRVQNGPTLQGSAAHAAVDAQGHVQMLVSLDWDDHNMIVIGEADGPIHAAVMSTWRSFKPGYAGYAAVPPIVQALNPPRYLLEVVDTSAGAGTVGYVAGTLDQVAPYVAGKFDSSVPRAFEVGDPGVMHMAGNYQLELLDFATGQHVSDIITPVQSGSLGNSFAHFFNDSLFMFGDAQRFSIQRRWDKGTGPVGFIDYADPDHGAGDLGTDGVDMVWIETHGPATQNAFWTTADYWTSPYVADKKDLKPRRLRSEIPNALIGVPVQVGCGYAALDNGVGVRVIRLSDGWSWMLAGDGTGWSWVNALAVTCQHVYIRVSYKTSIWLARVPIASLGQGVAPD